MATDKPGHELSQNAAIWDIYMDEAEDYDHKLVKDRQDSLDNLLIFAGLFSAIQTAFLVESKNLLQQDPTDSSVSLLLFIAQSQQRMELGLPSPPGMIAPLSAPTFQPLSTAQWVNGIWFCSLGLSLSAALIAMLGKEWLSSYLYSRPGGGHEYALDRQARLEGLRHWWALHIIALLPSLLHLSLLVFAVGLVLYLSNLNKDIALVFAIGVAAVLVFYLSTVVLGAVVPHCPFVTQASIYLKRVLHSCQNCVRRAKTQSTEKSVPNTAHKDVQALIWLASYSKDPEVVSCCHQAMVGLRQLLKPVSPTNPTGTTDPPRDSTDPPKQLPTKLYKKTTSDMFLSTVTQRFQTLLEGTLEFANPEVVVRYVIAIIAIRASMPSVPSMPIMQPSRITWLKLLELIDKIGFSRLSSGSISPTIFANLLIAEMEVINFALDAKNDEIRRQTQGDSYLDFTDASNSHRIVTIHERTNEWLQLVSMVLAHHSSGRILLDYDVLIRLFDSMEQATKPISMAMEHPDFEPLTQPVKFFIPFAEGNPVAYHSDDLLMSPLGGIVGILSMPMAAGDDLWYKLRRSALAAYRSLAPIVFHRVFQLDLSTEAPMEDLRKPPNNDTIAYHTVYCMMSAVNIFIKNQPQQQRLRREGRLIPMLDATLALVSHCLDTDQDSESPNVQPPDALRKHFSTLNDLHKALPTYGGLQTIPRLLESTIKIMTSALRNNISGQYPPSVLNLLQMVADCPNVSNCVEMLEAIDTFLGLNAEGEIADEESAYKKREGSDFITVCIDEFTSDPQGFPILVVVAANMECRNQTWAIFVKIVSFAADYRKLEYSAGRSATSAFLDGVKSVIGSQPDTSSSETEFLFPEFFIGAAKIMYLAGLEDSVSRQLITRHPAYQNVLSQLKQRWIWDQLDHDQEGVVKQLEDLRMPDDRGATSSSSSPKVPVEPEVFVEHKGDPTPSGSGEN